MISINSYLLQGRIPDFKLGRGGAHLKKLRRAEGGANIFGVFRVKNHDFTPKNHIFSNSRGGAGCALLDPPLYFVSDSGSLICCWSMMLPLYFVSDNGSLICCWSMMLPLYFVSDSGNLICCWSMMLPFLIYILIYIVKLFLE